MREPDVERSACDRRHPARDRPDDPAWRSFPASKLRAVPRIQPVSASWTTLPRGSGFTCSSRSANRTAKSSSRPIIAAALSCEAARSTDDPIRPRGSGRDCRHHRRRRAPDEVAPCLPLASTPCQGSEELARGAGTFDRVALMVRGVSISHASGTSKISATSIGSDAGNVRLHQADDRRDDEAVCWCCRSQAAEHLVSNGSSRSPRGPRAARSRWRWHRSPRPVRPES